MIPSNFPVRVNTLAPGTIYRGQHITFGPYYSFLVLDGGKVAQLDNGRTYDIDPGWLTQEILKGPSEFAEFRRVAWNRDTQGWEILTKGT